MNDAAPVTIEPTSGSSDVAGFSIMRAGMRVGTAAIVSNGDHRAELRWNANDEAIHDGSLLSGLRLTVQHAFEVLQLNRLETFVDEHDTTSIRLASQSGLRREGVLRSRGQYNQVVLARIAADPDPFTQEGFIGILNAGLPRKRVISQGILRDQLGRVLLCELTYKKEWDLPGGVIESGESPATGLVREIAEELGLVVEIQSLITVNWLPPWRGWDDACVFVFDLGVMDATITDNLTLQETEIKNTHWCDQGLVQQRGTKATIELLAGIQAPTVPTYREAPSSE